MIGGHSYALRGAPAVCCRRLRGSDEKKRRIRAQPNGLVGSGRCRQANVAASVGGRAGVSVRRGILGALVGATVPPATGESGQDGDGDGQDRYAGNAVAGVAGTAATAATDTLKPELTMLLSVLEDKAQRVLD